MIYVFYLITDDSSSPMLYAWTGDKSVAKLFKSQRCMKKFICKKMKFESIAHNEFNSYELTKVIMSIRQGDSLIDVGVVLTNNENFELESFLDNIDDVISLKLHYPTNSDIIKSLKKNYREIFKSIFDNYKNNGSQYIIDEYHAFSYLFGYTLFEHENELRCDPSNYYSSNELNTLLEKVSLPF